MTNMITAKNGLIGIMVVMIFLPVHVQALMEGLYCGSQNCYDGKLCNHARSMIINCIQYLNLVEKLVKPWIDFM